jgi:hypothetical protein
VAEAIQAGERSSLNRVLEVDQLPGAASHFDGPVLYDGDARGVIPAIFETAQTVEQHGHDRFRSDVTNDSAHKSALGFQISFSTFERAWLASLLCFPAAPGRWPARPQAHP